MNQPVRVLIVDDEERTRKALQAILASIDLHESGETHMAVEVVGKAADGREALESIKIYQPDVILMDVRMPGMGGLEATRFIKRTWPRVRVVLLSMYPISEIDALSVGADAILVKDGNIEELESAVLKPRQLDI